MNLGKRISLIFGAVALASGTAFADAYADGYSDVITYLYNLGHNNNGGTGAQIKEVLFSVTNGNFDVLAAGPGNGSTYFGGGLIDDGYDAGNGQGWNLFGYNDTAGFESTNSGFSDASNTQGHTNFATEDTYNELVYKITNTSTTKSEWFDLDMQDGVTAEVSLDSAANEYGEDEAILNFGYSNSQGAFTGNESSNTAYAFTGMAYGSDTYDYVSNTINEFYTGYLKPGQSIYFAVQTENASAAYAVVPSPAAVAPFILGLAAAARRRKKA